MLTLCTPGVEDAELVCDLGLLGHRCDDRGCEVVALSPMLGCPLSPWFGYEWLRTEFLFVFSGPTGRTGTSYARAPIAYATLRGCNLPDRVIWGELAQTDPTMMKSMPKA